MKNIVTLCLIVFLLLNCVGCSENYEDYTQAGNGTVYSFDIKSVISNDVNAASQIIYPKLVGNSANLEAVNEMIMQETEMQLKEILAEEYLNAVIKLDYTILFENDYLICFLFEGMFLTENSAHPTNIAFSVCLSLVEAEILDPLTLVETDEEFFRTMRENLGINQNADRFSNEQWEIVAKYIDAYSNDEIEEIIKTDSSKTLAVQPNGVLVLLPVPHALGDYIKILVPFSWNQKGIKTGGRFA